MKYLSFLFLSLLLIVQLVSCRHTLSPIRDYRESKTYIQNLEISLTNRDTISVERIFIASGLLTKTNLDKPIPLNHNLISEVVLRGLSNIGDIEISVSDSVKIVFVDKFAFNDPWNRKIDFQECYLSETEANQIVPYIEFSARTALEKEGGGGMESTVRTGNRIHNTRQGVVLAIFCKGEQVFSSGHYITDQFKDHKDSVTVYDFSIERLDSLMVLCLEDLEKEIKANKDRLK